MSIVIHNVSKQFGQFQALQPTNLTISSGKLVALLGPSGSGKSTLLRVISGLETPDTGSIIIDDQDHTHLDVRQRNIGFVFQHYALFKHLTIRQNIAFGLEIQRHPREAIRKRVNDLLDLIQLAGLGDRYPAQLSGGQRQRVALARALAVEPRVLLLDEPFGALDAKVRKELRSWLRRLHDEVHVTSVFVTHDQEEAMEVADEIVIMNQGKIEQVGTAVEVYDRPATPFVMGFIGTVNVIPKTSPIAKQFSSIEHTQDIFVRPQDVEIFSNPEPKTISATVERIIPMGSEIQIELRLSDNTILISYVSHFKFTQLQLKTAQNVFICVHKSQVFTEEAGGGHQTLNLATSGSHF
ncbi:MAG: sulfate ABC transporter ATP-binding protein [Oscillatoriales cyanobacterium]|nr:MAG: sulfate ABC transporter ATP-binding protein [Oscillatoriales cyanobacterium]